MSLNKFPIRRADPITRISTQRITKRTESDPADKSLSTGSRTFKGRVGTCRTEHDSIPEPPLHLCESFLNAAASAICCRHRGSPLSNQHHPLSPHFSAARSSTDKLSGLHNTTESSLRSAVSTKSPAKLGATLIFSTLKQTNRL